jgi:hypothetical protein
MACYEDSFIFFNILHWNIHLYCHVYHVCVWYVVWLITRRGFGLDTGFIHYGDYNYTDYSYWLLPQQLTTKYTLNDLTPLITATLANRWLLTAKAVFEDSLQSTDSSDSGD